MSSSEQPKLLAALDVRLSLAVLGVLLLAVIVGPIIAPWPYEVIDWDAVDSAPSLSHWFGTDGAGRDIFSRVLYGGQVSLSIAALATVVSFLIGVPWGAVAGYVGGRVDQVMMRIVDGMYSMPFVLIVIVLVVVFGRNIYLLFIGLGAVSWLDLARIARGQTLVVRHEKYIDSARAVGLSQLQIIWRHVIPNILAPVFVYATLTVPGVIIAESFISFLGLGVQEPATSWGVLIADGTRSLHSSPWQLIFPCAALIVTLLTLNVLGDRLRDRIASPAAKGVVR